MSKAEGKKIAIKFTMPLIGDASGNVSAFSVTGQEYKYINGPVINKTYTVEEVSNDGALEVYKADFSKGSFSNAENIQGIRLAEKSATQQLVSQNKSVTASSFKSPFIPSNAVDGNIDTRWGSDYSSPQYLIVDLGEEVPITSITINWEAACGKSYTVDVSLNASDWQTVYSTTNGKAGITVIDNIGATGRYVRVNGTVPSTSWGYSIYELSVYTSKPKYVDQGVYISELPTFHLGASINWEGSYPAGTEVKVFLTLDGDASTAEWEEVANGQIIDSQTKYYKVSLSTLDEDVTPVISKLWCQYDDIGDDILILSLNQFERFNNVEGQLKISYNSVLGTLAGVGGAVQSFDAYFTPTDLLREINPNDEETIRTVISNVTLNYDLISYEYAYHDHTINAVASVVVEYTDVTIVNP